jgi:hypothetical protein
MKRRTEHRLLIQAVSAQNPFPGLKIVTCRCGQWPALDEGFDSETAVRTAYREHVAQALEAAK